MRNLSGRHCLSIGATAAGRQQFAALTCSSSILMPIDRALGLRSPFSAWCVHLWLHNKQPPPPCLMASNTNPVIVFCNFCGSGNWAGSGGGVRFLLHLVSVSGLTRRAQKDVSAACGDGWSAVLSKDCPLSACVEPVGRGGFGGSLRAPKVSVPAENGNVVTSYVTQPWTSTALSFKAVSSCRTPRASRET